MHFSSKNTHHNVCSLFQIGPDLPFTIKKHSMVRIDSSTVLIIGGFQNGSNSNKVWEVDLSNNFTIKEGPCLNVPRNGHSCAKMNLNGKVIIVVAGGNDGKSCLDSVELLDPHLND